MRLLQKAFKKYWSIYFSVGVFTVALIALQFTPFSVSAIQEHHLLGGFLAAHIAHADSGGDSGGGSGGDSSGGDSGAGSDSGGGDGGCCGDSGGSGSDSEIGRAHV